MRRLLLLSLLLLTCSGAQAPQSVKSTASKTQGLPSQEAVTLTREPGLSAGVQAALRGLPAGVRYGVLVRQVGGGRVLEAFAPDQSFIPGSTQKLITGGAVLWERGGTGGWWSAELTVPAAQSGQAQVKFVTLRGSGDPTLSVSEGTYSLRALAQQAYSRGLRTAGQVRIDDLRFDATTWKDAVIGVPMTALRLAEWHDSPPANAEQARERIGAALIAELRRAGIKVLSDVVAQAAPDTPYVPLLRKDDQGKPLPPDPVIPPARRPEEGLASVRSAGPQVILDATARPSDNLRAEELLATLAHRPQGNGTLGGALARERAFLRQLGVDLTGVQLADGSGLSRENHLTARALGQLLAVMHDLPYPLPGKTALPSPLYRQRGNAFVEMLSQAGTGENRPLHDGRGGTLALRLKNSGLDVRAKTGTLPGVSALAGYVTASSGQTLAFVILMNGPETAPILTMRAVQDQVVQAIAQAH